MVKAYRNGTENVSCQKRLFQHSVLKTTWSKERFIGSEFITNITIRVEDVLLDQNSNNQKMLRVVRTEKAEDCNHTTDPCMFPSKKCPSHLGLAQCFDPRSFWFTNTFENWIKVHAPFHR